MQRETALKITQRERRRHSAVTIRDNHFTDHIGFFSNTSQEAKQLLQRIAEEVNLQSLDASHFETEYTVFNQPNEELKSD